MPSIAQFRKAPRLSSSDLTFSVISFVNLMTHLRPVPLLFSIECNSWNNVRRDEDDGFKLGIFSLGGGQKKGGLWEATAPPATPKLLSTFDSFPCSLTLFSVAVD